MWIRKTMKKENETGTVRKLQDRRSQKESVLSRPTTLLKGLTHSVITLHPHISQLFCHQYSPQPFLLCCLCCLCFNSLFPTTPQKFVEKRTTTGFWQIIFTTKPWSSPSELKNLSICMSPSRHVGQEPPWEVLRPRADMERNLAQSHRSSKTRSKLVLWFLLHTVQQWNWAGVGWPICSVAMTMGYRAQNIAPSSFAAWLLWADGTLKKHNVRELPIVITLHHFDLCKVKGATHLKGQRSASIVFLWK